VDGLLDTIKLTCGFQTLFLNPVKNNMEQIEEDQVVIKMSANSCVK
jgi:hypothetical protein